MNFINFGYNTVLDSYLNSKVKISVIKKQPNTHTPNNKSESTNRRQSKNEYKPSEYVVVNPYLCVNIEPRF